MAWTNTTNKSSATFTNIGKTLVESLLLLESGDYLLLEDGFKMILEQSVPTIPTWTSLTKS